MRAEGQGRPVTFVLTPGERHETTAFSRLMGSGGIKRQGRGRPQLRLRALSGDKAYSSRAIHQYLWLRYIRCVIPRRKDERATGRFDRATYRKRNRMERLFKRLKQLRRVATRYEKRAVNYLAMVTLASILVWLRFAEAP